MSFPEVLANAGIITWASKKKKKKKFLNFVSNFSILT